MIPHWMRRIAKERINILFKLAAGSVRTHPERSRRYVELARRIAAKYKVRPTAKQQRSFCKECRAFLKPGVSVVVRLDSKMRRAVWTCGSCGAKRIYPYNRRPSASK